jgi:hypothetical protein
VRYPAAHQATKLTQIASALTMEKGHRKRAVKSTGPLKAAL